MSPAVRRMLASRHFILWVSLLYALLIAPFTPSFLSASNAVNVLASLLPLLIVAVGQTVVMITGGIDLSVTSTIALASTVGALVMTSAAPHGAAGILAMIAVGLCVGAVNGAAVAFIRMPPFMVTLATMMFFGGLAVQVTRSKNIGGLPREFNAIGDSLITVTLITALLVTVVQLVLTRSRWGRWVYAVGRNPRTALVSGVPVAATTAAAYILSGALAAVAAFIYTARLETGSPMLGQRILLDVIAAVVIGGTSLFGGRGNLIWTAVGVLFITLVDNSLNLIGVSNFAVLIAKGLVILGAATLDTLRTRYAFS